MKDKTPRLDSLFAHVCRSLFLSRPWIC